MLALVNRTQARPELEPPASEEKEILLTPALVPKVERPTAKVAGGEKSAPAAKPVELPEKSAGSATLSSDVGDAKAGPASPAAAAESKSDFPSVASASEITRQPAEQFVSSTVQPTTEDEREFPL
jgi:hypothetical protein